MTKNIFDPLNLKKKFIFHLIKIYFLKLKNSNLTEVNLLAKVVKKEKYVETKYYSNILAIQ